MQPWKFCQPHRSFSPRAAAGMTLLEVMVAMFILAVVAVSGLNLLSSGADNLQHREKVLLAGLVAHNKLVELRLNQQERSTGEYKGREQQSGQDFSWRMVVTPSLNKNFLQAEIFVYEPPGTETQLLSLAAVVPGQ